MTVYRRSLRGGINSRRARRSSRSADAAGGSEVERIRNNWAVVRQRHVIDAMKWSSSARIASR
jgi:hypothetical protein